MSGIFSASERMELSPVVTFEPWPVDTAGLLKTQYAGSHIASFTVSAAFQSLCISYQL